MNYQLPQPTNELWRRTRPDTFSFPEQGAASSGIEIRMENPGEEGLHLLTLQEGFGHFPAIFRGSEDRKYVNDLSRYTEENAREGYVLFVEPSVTIKTPLKIFIDLPSHDYRLMRNTIIIGAGADVTLVESVSDSGDGQVFASLRTVLGEGAKLTMRRNWKWQGDNYSHSHATLARDAHFDLVTCITGGKVSKFEETIDLPGAGASLDLLLADLVSGRSHVDATLEVLHRAPQTYSRVEARGIVRDRSYSLHHGIIRVLPESIGADTYFKSGHLMLSTKGRADSIPKLEIGTDEVRAGHGHTFSDVDREAMFYLMSRGIPRHEAEQMCVDGFLAPLYERFPELSELMR